MAIRPATGSDARDIARIMRVARESFAWMPTVHTPDEDLAFISGTVLPLQCVTVAEAGGGIVGFIAVHGGWVEQLYLDPAWTGRGIGSRLLDEATGGMAEVRLHFPGQFRRSAFLRTARIQGREIRRRLRK